MDSEKEITLLTRFLSIISKGKLGEYEARALIERFGSISEMTLLPAQQLMRVGRLSAIQAEFMAFLPQIVRRCRLEQCGNTPRLDRLEKASAYVRALYTGSVHEQARLLCLDDRFNLIEACLLSSGSRLETSVSPRVVMENVLRTQTHAVILCHNHPGGRAFFSEADVASTIAAMGYLEMLDVALLDHLLAARGEVSSMRLAHYVHESRWTGGTQALPLSRWMNGTEEGERS